MSTTFEGDDFSINVVFNKQASLRIRPEQWVTFSLDKHVCKTTQLTGIFGAIEDDLCFLMNQALLLADSLKLS